MSRVSFPPAALDFNGHWAECPWVNTGARDQIRAILDSAADERRADFERRVRGIYADHATKGLLRSGPTIEVVLRSMEESGEALLKHGLDEVSRIAKDAEAFALVNSHVESHIAFLETHLDDVLRVSGAQKNGLVMSAASREARLSFAKVRSNLMRKMEIHRSSFMGSCRPAASTGQRDAAIFDPVGLERNKGGKPLAKHWDAMWATIAARIFAGDLEPQTQADIERAMKDWFADNDRDIGDTAIRARAHALWAAMKKIE